MPFFSFGPEAHPRRAVYALLELVVVSLAGVTGADTAESFLPCMHFHARAQMTTTDRNAKREKPAATSGRLVSSKVGGGGDAGSAGGVGGGGEDAGGGGGGSGLGDGGGGLGDGGSGGGDGGSGEGSSSHGVAGALVILAGETSIPL